MVEGEREKKKMFAQWGSARARKARSLRTREVVSGDLTLMSVTLPEWGTARSQVFGKRHGAREDLSATELQITNQRLFPSVLYPGIIIASDIKGIRDGERATSLTAVRGYIFELHAQTGRTRRTDSADSHIFDQT